MYQVQVRAYTIKHDKREEVSRFISDYRRLLQIAIDQIWSHIEWRKKPNRGPYKGLGKRRDATRIIPFIPQDGGFKHHELRSSLLEGWPYSKHYVDSVIKQAYSIMNSWRCNYVKGKRRAEKPVVKRRFVQIKETLYTHHDGVIRISIKPHQEYVNFDISRAWFLNRAEGSMGELILKEDSLTITFRKKLRLEAPRNRIAWDSNEASLDAFHPELGWVRVDLKEAYHIHRTYELKRKRLQKKASKKPSLKAKLEKYSARERSRTKNLMHKKTSTLTPYPIQHYFERLNKQGMFTHNRSHNRKLAKSDWTLFQRFLAYKTGRTGGSLNPYNSTRRCSKCGGVNEALNGATTLECRFCGLKIDRQLNAAVNLYLQMEGLSPSPKLFQELMKDWSGFTQTGEKACENLDELERGSRLMNPQENMITFSHVF
nr:zinc ribbon domain-containing protein [Candidatus Freyarchaeota archaeon]